MEHGIPDSLYFITRLKSCVFNESKISFVITTFFMDYRSIISERLEQIIGLYEGREGFGGVGPGIHWGQEGIPNIYLWSADYNDHIRSTHLVGLKYRVDDGSFEVAHGGPGSKTTDVEEAFTRFQQEIEKIPEKLRMFAEQNHSKEGTN